MLVVKRRVNYTQQLQHASTRQCFNEQ
jgi:hypothetical protein